MKRKQHSKEFKAKVALEALKGQKTANEIATEYRIVVDPSVKTVPTKNKI